MRALARLFFVGAVLGCGPANGPVSSPARPLGVASAPGDTSLHLAFSDISAVQKPSVPIQLTASDGSGLALVGLEARAVLDDPLAFTELHLTFENTENRVREGTFSIVLPQGAAISRFAMKTDGGLQEGEVVERKQAREAYEDFLHRKQDPALLEQNAGNEFSARVFPIPAKGKKELIVSYSQEVTAGAPYVLPLKGLPKVGTLQIEAFVAGRAAPLQRIAKQDVVPDEDFRLDAKVLGQRGGLRNGNLVAVRVKPVVTSRPEPLVGSLILVDTSASRALGAAEEGRIVRRLCAAIARAAGEGGQVIVAAYDQAIEPIYEGPAAGFGDEHIGKMRQRLALGASNLGAALSWAGEHAKAKGLTRVVLVSDGIPTAGATAGERLRARVASWKEQGIERLDAIGVGGIRDDDLLRSLANAGLAKGGVVIDGGVAEEEMVRRLSEATVSGVELKVENAKFVFPQKLDGLQAGDEALVFANVPDAQRVRVSVGGTWETPELVQVERPLLERAWVGAKIKSLLEEERKSGSTEALSNEIVGLSTKFRVLSPRSALLVLESERDYQRFGIDRSSLADILVTDGARVSLLRRSTPPPPKAPPPPPPPPKPKPQTGLGSDPMSARGNMWGDATGDAFGAGGLGLSGIGEGGSGRGEGIGLGQVGTIGHGAGTGSSSGFGSGAATSTAPVIAPPPLPPVVLQDSPPLASNPMPLAGAAQEQEEARARSRAAPRAQGEPDRTEQWEKINPYSGPFKTVMDLLSQRRVNEAVSTAFEWRKRDPGDVLALVALGEGFEAAGDAAQAARCYGSIIDLFPSRADMRRFAGERLERLALPAALDLAVDTYEKAEEQRPDHPASHRLLAYALLRKGEPQKAFNAIVSGLRRPYPSDRFAGVRRVLGEDLGLIGAAWAKAEPSLAAEIQRRIRQEGGLIEDQPSIRFVLNWETDANDVDFHIKDGKGNHAFYSHPALESGGLLYGDVTTGYGPECFTIRDAAAQRSGPYVLEANYYSRGPMGYGMGKLEIIEHDGHGNLTFEERPYVVMVDHAFVDLGRIQR